MIYLILIFAFVIRLISLNQSLWLDEATSVLTASNFSLTEIITKFAPGDFHPPLYYLLLKFWLSAFGNSEVVVRLLSVVFGVATVYVIYLIGKKLFTEKLAFVASLIFAIAPLHIYYSQEARMYSLATFLSTVSVLFFLKILEKKPKILDWVLFSFSLALLVFTDYLPALMIPVFVSTALVARKKWDWWKNFLFSFIPLIFIFSFWLPIFIKQLTSGLSVKAISPNWWGILGKANLKNFLLIPVKFMLGRISFINKSIYALAIAIFAGIYAYLFYQTKKIFPKTIILWCWLLLPILLSLVIALKVPSLSYFRLIFCLPAFYLLIAVGLTQIKKNISTILLLAVLILNFWASGNYLLNSRFQREDWRGLVNFIKNESRGIKSQVIFVANSQMEAFSYYAKDINFGGPKILNRVNKQIWLMRYVQPIFDPDDSVRYEVEKLGFKKLGEFDFNGVVVWRYNK